jgi:succinyl-CoA synthetase beta subunit
MSLLVFDLFSGGRIMADLSMCGDCTTKACVKRCVSSTLDPVLVIDGGSPRLARTDVATESGWCVECLACELDCAREGRGAIRINLPDDERE